MSLKLHEIFLPTEYVVEIAVDRDAYRWMTDNDLTKERLQAEDVAKGVRRHIDGIHNAVVVPRNYACKFCSSSRGQGIENGAPWCCDEAVEAFDEGEPL